MSSIRALGAVDLPAPAGEVFTYVADYANAPCFIPCLRRLLPVDGATYGLGARFIAELGFAGLSYAFEFVVTRFEPGRLMEAETTDGPRASCRWQFRSRPEGQTAAEFQCECELPVPLFGLPGRAVAGVVREALRRNLEEGMSRLAEAFEPPPARPSAAEPAERALPAY